ncbi:MAG: hypothetical protein ACPGSB_09360, partial [Opitutales bacterium]
EEPEQGERAIQALERAVLQWELLVKTTEVTHAVMPLAQVYPHKGRGEDGRRFHWKLLLPAVKRELQHVVKEIRE